MTNEPTFRYINFLAEMVASDRPVEQTNRDANKRVVVTSPKGHFNTVWRRELIVALMPWHIGAIVYYSIT